MIITKLLHFLATLPTLSAPAVHATIASAVQQVIQQYQRQLDRNWE